MSTYADPLVDGAIPMSAYEGQVWDTLNEHWQQRNNRRGLPNWASAALGRTGEAAGNAVRRVTDVVPESVTEPIRRAGDAVTEKAMRPALAGAVALLELVNDSVLELNDPKNVAKLARKRGLELDSFTGLRQQDLKFCDRLLTRNTLKWRATGAFESGAMGLLAMVPVAGVPIAMTADILVVQVLSTSIAARIAYSYGYDAKDPDEQDFIQRLVQRSFMAQAAKAKPLRETARAANAVKGRINWSQKLRQDHRLLASLEKLMKQLGPAGRGQRVAAAADARRSSRSAVRRAPAGAGRCRRGASCSGDGDAPNPRLTMVTRHICALAMSHPNVRQKLYSPNARPSRVVYSRSDTAAFTTHRASRSTSNPRQVSAHRPADLLQPVGWRHTSFWLTNPSDVSPSAAHRRSEAPPTSVWSNWYAALCWCPQRIAARHRATGQLSFYRCPGRSGGRTVR
ncbi:EcsC protein [Actinobacteria bacterium OK006]|nr:EcsC protein [Actinobacteria bacterium OK006]